MWIQSRPWTERATDRPRQSRAGPFARKGQMNQLSLESRVRIAAALVDGMSIRAVERLTGHHRDTVMRFGVEAGEACERLHDALVRGVEAKIIECDELWSFVQKKRR